MGDACSNGVRASVEVLHAEPERMAPGDKSIALDLRVRLDNGEQVDVEMQSGDFYTEARRFGLKAVGVTASV
jgi:hypothetical protein